MAGGAGRSPRRVRAAAALGLLLLYVPLFGMAFDSFRLRDPASGESVATLSWYARLASDQAVLSALQRSLVIAAWTAVISAALGTLTALALSRGRMRGRALLHAVAHVPLIMPEIVLGLSLLVWFVLLKLTLGMLSITLAHVTFSLSYVILAVKGRLDELDVSLEDAARDLGAREWDVFRRVTLLLILPAILSGTALAFTISFDDFLITFFTSGVGSETLPLRIYSMVKYGISPEISALSTAMTLATVLLVVLFLRPRSRASSR